MQIHENDVTQLPAYSVHYTLPPSSSRGQQSLQMEQTLS